MTVQYQDHPPPPPTPFFHICPKFYHPLDLGRSILNELSHPPNGNQLIKRKHNPSMTIICYRVLPLGRLSFLVSTH